jgi:hypothetical protein
MITLRDMIARYDPSRSSTFLMLETCQADFQNNHLVVTSLGHISDADWATVLASFPIPDADYSIDTLILEDGIHVLLLNFN